MLDYHAENIYNVVLLSHTGAGKTSLAEALLYRSGAISRLGRVEEGNTTSDYEPEEIKRQSSISLSPLPLEWKGHKVNIIDTPGYTDFVGEVQAALRAADAAVIMICAASGIEVGTEQVWHYADEAGLPRIIFVNKIDRDNADFYKVVGQIHSIFGRKCIPIQLPIGSQQSFQGVVDLITMTPETPSLAEQVESFGERLVEAVAESDDNLATKYLEGGGLTEDELRDGLRQGVICGDIVPILVGTAFANASGLLDAICELLPSAKDRSKIIAHKPDTKEEVIVESEEEGPLAALVFKTTADPYVGKLTYFRVYSGTLDSDSSRWNANKGRAERIGQLYTVRGKAQEPVSQVRAGDIGAVAKLIETSTSDTLCTQSLSLTFTPIIFPTPALSMAVYPETKADLDKLGPVLGRMVEEDPSLSVRREPDTGETILSGQGEAHLEVTREKMRRKFGVNTRLELPKIPYKETITISTKAEYKHKKQTGGHGQYGHVFLELEPLPRGSGYEFAERVVGGAVPKNYIPAVEKGVHEALQEGVIASYPLTDIKVTLYDGSSHPVDSSDISFKIAGAHALRKGAAQGQPVLLEPIMKVRLTIPQEFTGDVISDLNGKRARIIGMNPLNGTNIIEAQAPQAEMLRYAIELRSITQGRGSFTIGFSHYEEVPPHAAQKVIAESKKVP
jgi:elongation factor G